MMFIFDTMETLINKPKTRKRPAGRKGEKIPIETFDFRITDKILQSEEKFENIKLQITRQGKLLKAKYDVKLSVDSDILFWLKTVSQVNGYGYRQYIEQLVAEQMINFLDLLYEED